MPWRKLSSSVRRPDVPGWVARTSRLAIPVARGVLIALGVLVASARPTPAPEATAGVPAATRAAYEQASREILCYCGCARQTVLDCTCGVAFGLRDEFEGRLARGESPDAIVASYIGEHGEQSRTVPPKKGLNLLAWFGPGIAIILALAAAVVIISVWSSRGRRTPPASPSVQRDEASALAQRVEAGLKEFDV